MGCRLPRTNACQSAPVNCEGEGTHCSSCRCACGLSQPLRKMNNVSPSHRQPGSRRLPHHRLDLAAELRQQFEEGRAGLRHARRPEQFDAVPPPRPARRATSPPDGPRRCRAPRTWAWPGATVSPSGRSSTGTPSCSSERQMAAIRSLSWWRMWATPVMVIGASANGAMAASVSVASDSGFMSTAEAAFQRPVAGNDGAVSFSAPP